MKYQKTADAIRTYYAALSMCDDMPFDDTATNVQALVLWSTQVDELRAEIGVAFAIEGPKSNRRENALAVADDACGLAFVVDLVEGYGHKNLKPESTP